LKNDAMFYIGVGFDIILISGIFYFFQEVIKLFKMIIG